LPLGSAIAITSPMLNFVIKIPMNKEILLTMNNVIFNNNSIVKIMFLQIFKRHSDVAVTS